MTTLSGGSATSPADPQPLALDLFCCQGGATKGYLDAGFRVIGVDLEDQPRYRRIGDEFHAADAIGFLQVHDSWIRENVAFIHASPPCQAYSRAWKIQQREHPDLIGPTRDALNELGIPWVIENVEEAWPELIDPVMLCGAMPDFDGLHTYRHRLFEAGGGLVLPQPAHPEHRAQTVKMGRPLEAGDWYHAVGNFSNVPYVRDDMGVPWMSRDGIRECIPPVYAQLVGDQVLAQIAVREVA